MVAQLNKASALRFALIVQNCRFDHIEASRAENTTQLVFIEINR